MPEIHWPVYHNPTREYTKILTASVLKHHWAIYQNPTSQRTKTPPGNMLLQSIANPPSQYIKTHSTLCQTRMEQTPLVKTRKQ